MDSTDVLQRIRTEVALFSVEAPLLVSRKSPSFLSNTSYYGGGGGDGDDTLNKNKSSRDRFITRMEITRPTLDIR